MFFIPRLWMFLTVMSGLFRILVSLCVVGRGIRCASPLEAEGEWVDLTHDLDEETLAWPGTQPFKLELAYTGFQKNGVWYAQNRYVLNLSHFVLGRQCLLLSCAYQNGIGSGKRPNARETGKQSPYFPMVVLRNRCAAVFSEFFFKR